MTKMGIVAEMSCGEKDFATIFSITSLVWLCISSYESNVFEIDEENFNIINLSHKRIRFEFDTVPSILGQRISFSMLLGMIHHQFSHTHSRYIKG